MKRIVTMTATALMIAGMTSLGLAGESTTHSKQTPAAQDQPASMTPVAAEQAGGAAQGKQSAVENGKSAVQGEKPAAHSTMTPESKKAEQKPQETRTEANPTK